jgi:hypothetical protein
VRIAYIISAYRNPDQLVRLIHRLVAVGVTVLVHIDLRSDQAIFDRVAEGVADKPEVHLLERHRCVWGDFGHVRATLKGIAELYRQDIDFDYLVLLTGQDYPIKTNAQIRQFLGRSQGRSYMAHFLLPTTEWEGGGMQRLNRRHLRLLGRHYTLPLRSRLPAGFAFYGGSSYWCLSRACIDYIDQFVRAHPSFVRFFRYVDVPDEIFFQTILMNSPLAPSIVDDDMRYIDWKDPAAGSPAVLGLEDFTRLASSTKLYARKFDDHVDAGILGRIDQELLGIVDSGTVPGHG